MLRSADGAEARAGTQWDKSGGEWLVSMSLPARADACADACADAINSDGMHPLDGWTIGRRVYVSPSASSFPFSLPSSLS